jgi:hypothetical protein
VSVKVETICSETSEKHREWLKKYEFYWKKEKKKVRGNTMAPNV